MPQAKKPAEHRQAIVNVLRSIAAAPDVRDLILDNFDCACKSSQSEGYKACSDQVLAMAKSLGYGAE